MGITKGLWGPYQGLQEYTFREALSNGVLQLASVNVSLMGTLALNLRRLFLEVQLPKPPSVIIIG